MKIYTSDEALLSAYSKENGQPDNILAKMKSTYQPHKYRGGIVIPDYGYSLERIRRGFVSSGRAGNPEIVK